MAKKKASRVWAQDHVRDPYVQQAQQAGYRARAAYKLIQLADANRLLRRGQCVVDLGAAPGSWSQVARERLRRADGTLDGRIVALDLLPMAPIAGVEFIQGDFREQSVLDALHACLQDTPVDLVMSDMAPNLSGVAVADAARVSHLAELALEFARQVLPAHGALLVKTFHGPGFSQIVQAYRRCFAQVRELKPDASRSRSAETFLLAQRLLPQARLTP